MIRKTSYRFVYIVGFLVCLFAIGASIGYFQLYLQLPPCTLCEEQRFVLIGMGVFFLAAAIHNPKNYGPKAYSVILLLLSLTGLIISIYQVYWQNQPITSAPTCTAGLNPLIQNLPGQSTLKTIFVGTKECFKQEEKIFSITIPMWSVFFFSGMSLVNLWQMLRKPAK